MRIKVTIPNDATGAAEYLGRMAYPGVTNAATRKKWSKAALGLPYKVHGKHPPAWLQGLRDDREDEREASRLDTVYHRGVKHLQHRRMTAVRIFLRLAAPPSRGGLKFMDAARSPTQPQPASSWATNTASLTAFEKVSLPSPWLCPSGG